jgi:hypothetical protein
MGRPCGSGREQRYGASWSREPRNSVRTSASPRSHSGLSTCSDPLVRPIADVVAQRIVGIHPRPPRVGLPAPLEFAADIHHGYPNRSGPHASAIVALVPYSLRRRLSMAPSKNSLSHRIIIACGTRFTESHQVRLDRLPARAGDPGLSLWGASAWR